MGIITKKNKYVVFLIKMKKISLWALFKMEKQLKQAI
jgi:hypothetical protein